MNYRDYYERHIEQDDLEYSVTKIAGLMADVSGSLEAGICDANTLQLLVKCFYEVGAAVEVAAALTIKYDFAGNQKDRDQMRAIGSKLDQQAWLLFKKYMDVCGGVRPRIDPRYVDPRYLAPIEEEDVEGFKQARRRQGYRLSGLSCACTLAGCGCER